MNQPRQLLMAIAGALVVVVLAWFMFLYKPKAGEISDVEAQVETAIAEEQSLRATLAQLQSVDEDRPSEEAEVRRLSAAIPPDPELANFILAVHDIVGRSDLEFASISPALPAVVPGQAVSTIAVTMTVSGNFPNLLDFLDRLQDLDRIVVVDALALSSIESGEASGTATSHATDTSADGAAVTSGSAPVEFALGTGAETVSVRTDAASAGRTAPTTTSTTQARAGALLVPRVPAVRIVSRVISVAVTARLFTTAAPGGGAAATTTTAPAGATTTTVAG